jgi:hypothetical protein
MLGFFPVDCARAGVVMANANAAQATSKVLGCLSFIQTSIEELVLRK